MAPISPSRLRANLYRMLDRVLASGEPLAIARRGGQLRIVPDRPRRLDLLKPHPDYLRTDPEELVHLDWSDRWRP